MNGEVRNVLRHRGWGHVACTDGDDDLPPDPRQLSRIQPVEGHVPLRGIDMQATSEWQHIVGRRRGHQAQSLKALQDMLLSDVGDDVVVGCAALSAADSKDPAVIDVGGVKMRLPLSPADAEVLYQRCGTSFVGVRGVVGAQFDAERRASTELPIFRRGKSKPSSGPEAIGVGEEGVGVTLPPSLDPFDLQGVVETVRTKLCPEAAQVGVMPYKLVAYTEGDFFAPHVDTPSNDFHFGTLAVHMPTLYDYAIAGHAPSISCLCNDHGVDLPPPPPPMPKHKLHEIDDEECLPSGVPRQGGSLIFYFGRQVGCPGDVDPTEYEGHYGYDPEVPETLQTMCFQELDPAEPSLRAFLNSTNQGSRIGYGQPKRGDAAALEVRVNLGRYDADALPLSNNREVRANWAAWTADTVHEVTPMRSGPRVAPYRFVATFKLFKKGTSLLRVPRRAALEAQLALVFDEMRQLKSRSPSSSADHMPVGLAFLLRHQYPPAGLTPMALKGLDAVVHSVCSNYVNPNPVETCKPQVKYGVFVVPVVVSRNDCPNVPFNIVFDPLRTAFVLRDATDAQFIAKVRAGETGPTDGLRHSVELRRERADDTNLHLWLPSLTKVQWVQLGHGQLLGGGVSYGNASCGGEWWYSAAALVMSPLIPPSRWEQRRWILFAAFRASAAWRRCLKHKVALHTIVSFV